MNVTSLLNTSGGAKAPGGNPPSDPATVSDYQAGERSMEVKTPVNTPSDSMLHGRNNRMPWDAGGYSLPLSLNIKNGQHSPGSRPAFYSEPPVPADCTGSTSPKPPSHRFTDSHSSLSSYMTMSSNTSSHSRSHSRISSLSTVSEYQPLGMFFPDTTRMEKATSDTISGMQYPTVFEIPRPTLSSTVSRKSVEDASFDENSSRGHSGHQDHLQSPSDAILASNRGLTGSESPTNFSTIESSFCADSSPISTSRAHKRTVSAPNFPSLNNTTSRSHHFPEFGPMSEPTPPKSPQGSNDAQAAPMEPAMSESTSTQPIAGESVPIRLFTTESVATAPVQPSQSAGTPALPEIPEPKCLFVTACTTGSDLRKAVSHIFGRNKLCTKAIPKHMWVHYCRKHYQRSRYRNGFDYALKQANMVMLQIRRVQDWSDRNGQTGHRDDGILRCWNLGVRRREARRLEEQEHAASQKRRYSEFDDDLGQYDEGDEYDDDKDDDEEDMDDQLQSRAMAMASAGAIPNWLKAKLYQEYSSVQVLEIVQEIKSRMESGEMQCIPDIEILPDIITDNGSSLPKARSNATTHRRKPKSNARNTPSASSSSQSGTPDPQGPKRVRTSAGLHNMNMPMQNMSGQHMPMRNSMSYQPNNGSMGYQYQPNNGGFGAIAENQASPDFWGTPSYGINNVLPAPVPQRHSDMARTASSNGIQSACPAAQRRGNMPMASTHSNGAQPSYPVPGRPLHARSMSENLTLQGHNRFRHYALSGQSYPQQDMAMSYNPATGYNSPAAYQGYNTNASTNANMGHSDHQNDNYFSPFNGGPADMGTPRQQQQQPYAHRLQGTPSFHVRPLQHRPAPSVSSGPPPPPMNSHRSVNNGNAISAYGSGANYMAKDHMGLPSFPKEEGYGYSSAPNYLAKDHMGLPSLPKEDGYGQYPRHHDSRF